LPKSSDVFGRPTTKQQMSRSISVDSKVGCRYNPFLSVDRTMLKIVQCHIRLALSRRRTSLYAIHREDTVDDVSFYYIMTVGSIRRLRMVPEMEMTS